MTRRKGWAPPRKRKKRIAKKMSKNQRIQAGWRPQYVAVLNDEMSEEFVRHVAVISDGMSEEFVRQLISVQEYRKSIL